uniref:60S ribosomal export protein NMD3 n=1 Tax=Parascaris univalens TaxID=6257 RepID=A0A915AB21_PARUN
MEALQLETESPGRIICCECGALIEPNAANMCVACVRSKVDITEGIPKQSQLINCKFCRRFLMPPNGWLHAPLESKELLSLALRKLKPTMTKVRLTDASFIWTEPHSKRIKVKLTIQKEIMSGAVLQQTFVVEFIIQNQICEDCRRVEAKDYWRACVQVRQRCDFKKTLFYLEQLVLKHAAHVNTTGVKPVASGIDFYYAKQQDARKLVDFLLSVLPCKYRYAQELVTHDPRNNTYDYKHTFCVDIVPICKDSVICLPKRIAQSLGNMSQLVVCLRVSNVITLIDPSTLQMADVTASQYWRDPFEALCQSKQLTEFYVLDVEEIGDLKRSAGHGHVSAKHLLADVWVVRSNQVGENDAQTVCCRTHLGHLLKPGDLVLGFDILNSNVNSRVLDEMKAENVADVILVKKVFDRALRQRRRIWKLKRLVANGSIVNETASMENEFEGFMEDLEEDEQMREKVNIYKAREHVPPIDEDDNSVDLPPGPSLAEMLDDLDINADVEMAGV